MTTTPLRIAPVPAVAAGRVSGRVIVAQEELFERRRLADETAHAGVTEHADELTQAFAIDLGAQRITLDADVLDALDPPEIARIAGHFGPDRDAAQMPHGAQRTTFDGLARPDDRHAFAQRFRFGQDVAGQQHRRAPVAGLRHALLKHVLHQRVQSTAGLVQEQQPGMGRERRDEGDLGGCPSNTCGPSCAGPNRSARSAPRGAACRCRRACGPAGRWSLHLSATATASHHQERKRFDDAAQRIGSRDHRPATARYRCRPSPGPAGCGWWWTSRRR